MNITMRSYISKHLLACACFCVFAFLYHDAYAAPKGTIITVAGGGTYQNVSASALGLSFSGIATDASGSVYFSESTGNTVRKIAPGGVVTTIAGTGAAGYSGDGGPATSAKLKNPMNIACDSSGNVFIVDSGNYCIRKIAANGIITTIAGGGTGDLVQAIIASLNSPKGVAFDPAGNMYITEYYNNCIRKVATNGIISTIAGTGTAGYTGDRGPAISATLNGPQDIALDSSGNIYVADRYNNCIRRISTDGIITTVVGGNGVGDTFIATSARLNKPMNIVFDSSGNMYIADTSNNRIRKVATNGIITTVAGTGSAGYSGDTGPATSATLRHPNVAMVNSSGTVYIADSFNNCIRKIDLNGIITTIAGIAGVTGCGGDGEAATNALLNTPYNFAFDSSGNMYIADFGNNRIRKVDTSGIITTVAGTGVSGYSGDNGPATSAKLWSPSYVCFDSSGNMYIADYSNCCIRKIATNGIITTVAGTGTLGFSGDGGQATSAKLNNPMNIAFDSSGNMYIADFGNHRIRKVATNGNITTVAGTGTGSFSGDGGQATSATLNWPAGVTFDSSGNMYIADYNNSRIRKVATNGVITTVAGGGGGDNAPALCATISAPTGIAFDSSGNLYIADKDNNLVRKVDTNGIITTVAGTGTSGFSGDGGQATSATLNWPYSVTLDSSGNLYIGDYYNYRVRKVATNGIISTVVGTGGGSFSGDGGQAASAQIASPVCVRFDSSGNMYISDSNNQRIRKVATNGIITTVAGTGTASFSGDGGQATSATINWSSGLTFDSSGNLYIADSSNNRIRKVATNGIITTVVAGGAAENVPATSIKLVNIYGIGIDSSGTLYFGDSSNYRIRKVDASGMLTTVAGTGTAGYTGDGGPAISANIKNALSIAFDPSGNMYFPDYNNAVIRKVAANGIITTFAGTGSNGFSGDGGLATSAALSYPWSVACDASGNLYIADYVNYRIRKVATNGIITTYAGGGTYGIIGDNGPATSAYLTSPMGVAVDPSGNVYIMDTYRIRKVAANGIITTFAGGDPGNGVSALNIQLNYPGGLVFDSSNNLYITDTNNCVVRKIATNGIITTIAGNGTPSFSGDGGQATSAALNCPTDVALDSSGNIYIADWNNSCVRKVATNGIITTFAGTGASGFSGDGGQATSAIMYHVSSVAVNSSGNLYLSDIANNRIRKVATNGVITTVVGTGTSGYSGDGGQATSAKIGQPYGIRFDSLGNLYLADSDNHCIRKIATNGVITTVAGIGGTRGYFGDTIPATSTALYNPSAIAFDSSGNMYIADRSNNRIRKVDTNGIISTIAGTSIPGFSGDGGPAIKADIYNPYGVAIDSAGDLYFSETVSGRIRKVFMNTDTTPPGPVTNLAAVQTTNSNQVNLTWTNPVADDLSSVVIRYRNDSYPTSASDGQAVGEVATTVSGGAGSITHSNLTWGATYYYSVFAKDSSNNYSTSAIKSVKVAATNAYFVFGMDNTTAQTAGTNFTTTITAKAIDGSTLTTYSGIPVASAVYVSPATGTVSLTTASATAFVNGIATYTFNYPDAGTIGIRLLDNENSMDTTSSNIKFKPASFTVTPISLAQQAGKPFNLTVTALNSAGAATPNYSGTVVLSINYVAPTSGSKSLSVTSIAPALFKSGVATVNLSYSDCGTITVKATDSTYAQGATITGTSNNIIFYPAKFTVNVQSPPGARSAFYLNEELNTTVIAQDYNNNTTPNYLGKVLITSQPGYSGPADYTFISTDAGTHLFQGLKFSTAGSFTINATDAAYSTATGASQTFQVINAKLIIPSVSGAAGTLAGGCYILNTGTNQVVASDKTTTVTLSKIESVMNSTSSFDKTSLVMNNGTASFNLTDPEAETVTVSAVTNPVLPVQQGIFTFGSSTNNTFRIEYNFEVTNYAKQVPSSYTVPTTPTNGLPATYNQSGLYETAVSTGFQSYSKSGQPNSSTLGQTPIPINYTPIIATGTRTQNTYTPPRDMSMAQGALSTNAKDTNTYIPLPSNTQAKEQESMFGQPPSYENMTEGAPNMFDNPNMTQSADEEKKHKEEEKDKDKKDQNTTPAETLETQQPVEIINK